MILSLLLFLIGILVLSLNRTNIFIKIFSSLLALNFNFISNVAPGFLVFFDGGSDPGEGSGSQEDKSGSDSKSSKGQTISQSTNETNPPKSGFVLAVWLRNYYLSMLRMDNDHSDKNKARWWRVIFPGSELPESEKKNSQNQDSNDSGDGGE